MHAVEAQLFAWHEIHKALGVARQRLKTSSSSGLARAAAEAEVKKLQRDSDRAFAEVQARLADRSRGSSRAVAAQSLR